MKNILFICHGNICRSPMAEFVMKDLVTWSRRFTRTRSGCCTVPYRVDGHAARQLTNQDYDKYDLLIGMDSANLRNMHRICGGDFAANCVVFSRRNLENLQWYSMTHGGNRKVAAFVVFGIL